MSELSRWTILACTNCQATQFTEIWQLKHHPTGGTTKESQGMRCLACGSATDVQQMWRGIERKRLKAEMDRLADEMENGHGGDLVVPTRREIV